MIRSKNRKLVAVLAVVGGLWVGGAGVARAHEGPVGHDPVAAIKAGKEMAEAATHLWNALTPEEQKQAGFAFKDDERLNWHFIPKARKGLPWKQMSPAQRALAHALFSSGLSQRGYAKAETVMSLDAILADMEKGRQGTPVRDPDLYFFSIFGNPAAKDSKEPWGWRVEGHHLSFNFTIVGDKGVIGGPIFIGTNPAEVREGPRKGLRVLGVEEDLGRTLVKSLNDVQKKKAVVAEKAPADIVSFNAKQAKLLDPPGLTVAEMTPEQKVQLTTLLKEYAHRLRDELADNDMDRIEKAGFDKVTFAWAGGTERGDPHYYRVQGPTFLVEYDNTQNGANHVHSVWRDLENDFGGDVLKQHYEQDHK